MAALSPRAIRRNPVKFAATEKPIQDEIREAVPPILEKMTWGNNENILDHGLNSGKKVFEILAPIAERTSSTVYILDNCPYTIEHAGTAYPHAKVQQILGDMDLQPGTLCDLRFNKIFSLYGLYYSVDYRSALKNMYDHLLPGGEAFFMIPTLSHVYDLNKTLCDHPEFGDHAEEHFPVPDFAHDGKDNAGLLKDAFIATGFELKDFVVVKRTLEYRNRKESADFFLSINPFLLLLPKGKHAKLEAIYYKHFEETKTSLYDPTSASPYDKYLFPYECAHIFLKKPE